MPATVTIIDSGELLDGDFRYLHYNTGEYDIYSNNHRLDLSRVLSSNTFGHVQLDTAGVAWVVGVAYRPREDAHISLELDVNFRGNPHDVLVHVANELRDRCIMAQA